MRVYDIIAKKRDGGELNKEEIDFLIRGFVENTIPDYQIAAWAMAVFLRGMTDQETVYLCETMINSGEKIDLSSIEGIKVDKHSTGGVGDTTTLVLGPLVAAGGIPVAKMSGRGLGHTGGTIDKLEAIPGFNVQINKDKFIEQVNKLKLAVVGQSGNLVPADKKLYALRDVTATVNSIPLIASSIMSKKIAAGAEAILLDVKCGSGAFFEDLEEAKKLARLMVNIGNSVNRNTITVISNMDQPLGEAVGNSLEVQEAINTLKGVGPKDLTDLCIYLAGYMFVLGKKAENPTEGMEIAKNIIKSGRGLDVFQAFVSAQGGNADVISDFSLLPQAENSLTVNSSKSGYVEKIDTQAVGKAAMVLGAGRENKETKIDLSVGLKIKKKIGEQVESAETLATIFYNDYQKALEAKTIIEEAYHISDKKVAYPQLILDVIK